MLNAKMPGFLRKESSLPYSIIVGGIAAAGLAYVVVREALRSGWFAPEKAPPPKNAGAGRKTTRSGSAAPKMPTVYVRGAGHRYHQKGCPALGEGGVALPLDEARAAYDPCKLCDPPI